MSKQPASLLNRMFFIAIIIAIFLDLFVSEFLTQPYLLKLTLEKNIPTTIATIQLMFSGSLLYAIGNKAFHSPPIINRYWMILGAIFYFLAFDEWFSVHDPLGKAIAPLFGPLGDLFGWTFIFMILMPLFFIASIHFLKNIPRYVSAGFTLSGILFLTGAIGFELLQLNQFQKTVLDLTPYSHTFGIIEESLELLSIWLFNWIAIQYGCSKETIIIPTKALWITLVFCILDTLGTYIYRLT